LTAHAICHEKIDWGLLMIKPTRVLRKGPKNIRKSSLHLDILGSREVRWSKFRYWRNKNVSYQLIKSSSPGDLVDCICTTLLQHNENTNETLPEAFEFV